MGKAMDKDRDEQVAAEAKLFGELHDLWCNEGQTSGAGQATYNPDVDEEGLYMIGQCRYVDSYSIHKFAVWLADITSDEHNHSRRDPNSKYNHWLNKQRGWAG